MPSSSPRVPGGVPDIPGPGSYNHISDQRGGGFLGDAPSFTMGARKSVPRPDDASPGPLYSPRMLTSVATGPMGDAPEFSFGSSKRFPDSGTGDPGPGQYMQSTTRIGGSLLGDAPKYGFGTDERFNRLARQLNDAAESPGPGSYDDKGILGEQRSSKRVTEPAFGFGSSNREHISRVFVSDMHARASGSAVRGADEPPRRVLTRRAGVVLARAGARARMPCGRFVARPPCPHSLTRPPCPLRALVVPASRARGR